MHLKISKTHQPFRVQDFAAVILCARTDFFRGKVLLLFFSVLLKILSGASYCCCYTVCSYRLYQVQVTVVVILCARIAFFRCKLLLLLNYVLVSLFSCASYSRCYSLCSYRLFHVPVILTVILCARIAFFRCKLLLLLYCVLVLPFSGANYCCCYLACSNSLFQAQYAVFVILCVRTFYFRHKMLLLLFSVLGAALYLFLRQYRAKMRPVLEKAEKIPGPKALPLFGNALEFGTSTKGKDGMCSIIDLKYWSLLLYTFKSCLLNSSQTRVYSWYIIIILTSTPTLSSEHFYHLQAENIPRFLPEKNLIDTTYCDVFFSEFFDYIVWLNRTHGPIVRVWVGPILTVLLADPNYIEVRHSILHREKCSKTEPGCQGPRWWICTSPRCWKIWSSAWRVFIVFQLVHFVGQNTEYKIKFAPQFARRTTRKQRQLTEFVCVWEIPKAEFSTMNCLLAGCAG